MGNKGVWQCEKKKLAEKKRPGNLGGKHHDKTKIKPISTLVEKVEELGNQKCCKVQFENWGKIPSIGKGGIGGEGIQRKTFSHTANGGVAPIYYVADPLGRGRSREGINKKGKGTGFRTEAFSAGRERQNTN